MDTRPTNVLFNRRGFLQSAALGAAAVANSTQPAVSAENRQDSLRVGLIGAGRQGQALLELCAKDPSIQLVAVCDVWKEFNLARASRSLTRYRQEHKTFESHVDLLDGASDLDAVIIATPDCCHAEQTLACLQAGLHVYCETPMAHTLEDASRMVDAANESSRLLQIGNQRRSNPYYRFAHAHLVNETKLLGTITAVNGQWNRPVRPDRGWPRRATLPQATLDRLGYESMAQFCNWQRYAAFCDGPIAELGVHQIDVFNWFLDAQPTAVVASGGIEHYDPKTHEVFDTVMAILEYPSAAGTVRASYQTINSNSNLGHFEHFMGDEGTLCLSESVGRSKIYHEEQAPDWDKWVDLGYLQSTEPEEEESDGALLTVQKSVAPPSYELAVEFHDEPCHPHLQNFFSAVRGDAELNCPASVALSSIRVVDQIIAAAKGSS